MTRMGFAPKDDSEIATVSLKEKRFPKRLVLYIRPFDEYLNLLDFKPKDFYVYERL